MFLNLKFQTIKLLKSKFQQIFRAHFFIFPRFLNERPENWKYANYEGLFLGKNPVVIGI